MLFADVDLTALYSFLNSLLPEVQSISPFWAAVGAALLLVLQKTGSGGVLVNLAKGLFTRIFGPKTPSPLTVPAGLNAAEQGVLAAVIDKIKAVREAQSTQAAADHEAALKAAVAEVTK